MEKLGFKGKFTIRVRDAKTGKIIREIKGSNSICVGSREAVVKLLAQQTLPTDYTYNKIWAIYVGTGTTPPTTADEHLGAVAFKKACDQPFFTVSTSAGTVQVQMTVETTEGNGNVFTEIGLYTRGSEDNPNTPTVGAVMLARQIHGDIEKSSAMSIEYSWTIQVTV